MIGAASDTILVEREGLNLLIPLHRVVFIEQSARGGVCIHLDDHQDVLSTTPYSQVVWLIQTAARCRAEHNTDILTFEADQIK